MANDAYQLQGQNGGRALYGSVSWSAASTGDPPARWVQFLEDTVVTAIDSSIVNLESNLTAVAAVGQFTQIGGKTTLITITSGSVILYF
jgi:hypothetical protein